jgi:hypothetical protein
MYVVSKLQAVHQCRLFSYVHNKYSSRSRSPLHEALLEFSSVSHLRLPKSADGNDFKQYPANIDHLARICKQYHGHLSASGIAQGLATASCWLQKNSEPGFQHNVPSEPCICMAKDKLEKRCRTVCRPSSLFRMPGSTSRTRLITHLGI